MSPAHATAAFCAAVVLISLSACAVSDPVLRQAIAEVASHPETARVKLRPFAQRGDEAAFGPICVAYGRSIDSTVGPRERAEALAWCRHAAAAGGVEAQYHLGMFYKSGIGTAVDRTAALQWYLKAAGQGHQAAEDEARALQGKPAICRNWITHCRLM